jgi:8-oxo-dGTP pyrophosphatase MutT (NUDIX family)
MSARSPRRTESAGGVVLNRRGEVLVVNQRGTSWSLPKGHIDAGEDALGAARREIYEESGIRDLEFVRELGSYTRHKIGKDRGEEDLSELKTIHMFLFRTPETELKPVDPHNPEARWVKAGEVEALLTHRKDKEFFARIRGSLL